MQVLIIAAAGLALSAALTAADRPRRYHVGDIEMIEGSSAPVAQPKAPFACREVIPSLTTCGEGVAPLPAPVAVHVVSSSRPYGGWTYWRRGWTRSGARSASRARGRITAGYARR